jgi:acyl carrier protein
MDQKQIYSELTSVFRDIFDDENMTLTPELTARDVDGWNSLTHINLIVAAENHFHVRFKTAEIESMQNAGHFVELIERKLSGK